MAIAILASPAFFDATRPFFVQNQGDWALVSVRLHTSVFASPKLVSKFLQTFVVMSPTIGATNMLSVQRVLGTL